VNIVAFEVQILALLENLPELNICVNCREKVKLKSIFFALEGRGVICSDCGRKVREKLKMLNCTIATINHLSSRQIQNIGCLSVDLFLQGVIKKC
jgi:recombinational DNA repair protein (RecF pathway)